MVNTTISSSLRGRCPAPFYDAAQFGFGGCTCAAPFESYSVLTCIAVEGRFCAPIPNLGDCCLPCPATDYLYPSDFKKWYRAAEALNLAGLVCMLFLLLSFICLPAEQTRRHYLSYCLIVAAMFLAVSRRLSSDKSVLTSS